jgi:hypothetical protein
MARGVLAGEMGPDPSTVSLGNRRSTAPIFSEAIRFCRGEVSDKVTNALAALAAIEEEIFGLSESNPKNARSSGDENVRARIKQRMGCVVAQVVAAGPIWFIRSAVSK